MSTKSTGVAYLSTWLLLEQAYALLCRNLDRRLTRMGVSQAQASVLLGLRAAGHPLSLSRIGSLRVSQAPSVTALVDRLEARGLVRRVRTSHDRRIINLELTADGEVFCADLYPAHLEGLTETFDVLGIQELQSITHAFLTLRDRGAVLLQVSRTVFEETPAELGAFPSDFTESATRT